MDKTRMGNDGLKGGALSNLHAIQAAEKRDLQAVRDTERSSRRKKAMERGLMALSSIPI